MSYRNSGIEPIRNYAEALRKYEGTKHIRGRSEDQRPLGKREKVDSFRIWKNVNNDIQCILFSTPVVTFTTDDNIVINLGGWTSSTTCLFINEVIARGVSARIFDGSMVLRLENGKEYRIDDKKPTLLTRQYEEDDNFTTFTIDHWVKTTTHKINREAKAQALARYEAATRYLAAFNKLRQGAPVDDAEEARVLGDITKPWWNTRVSGYVELLPHIQQWASSTGDNSHEDFYKLAVLLSTPAKGVNMKLYENLLMGINRNKVFVEVEVPDGKVIKDAHKQYFTKPWDKFIATQFT